MKMLNFCAIAALAVICAPTFAAIRPPSGGGGTSGKGIRPNAGKPSQGATFVLKDTSRTGSTVLTLSVPDGYVPDGKAFWVNEPSNPFHWWVSLASRDGLYKTVFNDPRWLVKSSCGGSFANVPEFSTAEGLAGLLVADVASTYGLANVRIAEATYTPFQPQDSESVRQSRQLSREIRFLEFNAVFTGLRANGQGANVRCYSPVALMIWNGMEDTCFLELQCWVFCVYPNGGERRAKELMDLVPKHLSINQEFRQYVSQCSTQLTQQFIQNQNRERNQVQRWVDAQNEQQEQFQKVMSDRQDAYDRSFEAWRNVIKETETVSAGGNEAYEVPWGADNSYVDENGGFVQKSNDEFLEESRRSGRTVDQEKQNYESEHRTLRKLAPLKKPGNL